MGIKHTGTKSDGINATTVGNVSGSSVAHVILSHEQ